MFRKTNTRIAMLITSRNLLCKYVTIIIILSPCTQISLPDIGDDMIPTMWDLYRTMRPELSSLNIWQVTCVYAHLYF